MSARSHKQLPLPDFSPQSRSLNGSAIEHMHQLAQQSAERLACDHVALLKKRVNASIAALPADLLLPVFRRVRFDGIHIPAEWTTAPRDTYFWLEPSMTGMYNHCSFGNANRMDCATRLPPLGWSRFIYFQEKLPASKVIHVQWDIREGEMQKFFAWWGNESLMKMIDAASVIEECRESRKRLTDEQRAASPLQLCVDWDVEDHLRQLSRFNSNWMELPSPADIGSMHFTATGLQIVAPVILSTCDLILLTKHEVSVLSRRPMLKQFIFQHDDVRDWSNYLGGVRWDLKYKASQLNRCNEAHEMDPEEEYRYRDMRLEIQPADNNHRQLDPSLPRWHPVRRAYEEMIEWAAQSHVLTASSVTQESNGLDTQLAVTASGSTALSDGAISSRHRYTLRHSPLDDSLVTEASDSAAMTEDQ